MAVDVDGPRPTNRVNADYYRVTGARPPLAELAVELRRPQPVVS